MLCLWRITTSLQHHLAAFEPGEKQSPEALPRLVFVDVGLSLSHQGDSPFPLVSTRGYIEWLDF